jgi:hypothetical protein
MRDEEEMSDERERRASEEATSLRLELVVIPAEIVIVFGAGRTSVLVELRGDGVDDGLYLSQLLLEILQTGAGTVLLDPLASLLDGFENGLLIVIVEFATKTLLVTELRLETVDEGGEGVEGLNLLALNLVLSGELLGFTKHAVDLLLGETTLLVLDGDRFRLASSLVGGGHLHDTVGVNLKGDLNLRDTTGRGRNTSELEFAEKVVVFGQRTFTLIDLDEDSGLVVGGSGEDLALLSGDDSVTGDELGEDSASGLNTECKSGDINKNDLIRAFSTREDTSLNGGTVSDGLIRVDTLGGFLATEEVLEELLNLGDTSGTTDENDLINIFLLNTGILDNLLDGLHGLPEELHVEFFELGTGKGLREVVAVLERLDFDLSGLLTGEGTLGLLDLTLQLAHSPKVLGDVGTGLLLVALDKVIDDTVVEILTTKVSVTSGGQDLEDTIINRKEGNIEGSTTEIVDDDLGLALAFVETVGDGSGSRFVDDTKNLEAGNGSGILSGLTLSVVEV